MMQCRIPAIFLLGIALLGAAAAEAASVTGRLQSGDTTVSDKYRDSYTFQGTAGQRAIVDVTSTEFDTVVQLRAPSGSQQENDDYGGQARHSRIESNLTETGTYTVYVTSYGTNTTGSYTLQYPASASGTSAPTTRTVTGQLQSSDTAVDRKYRDSYTFQRTAGQSVVVDMTGSFDTYLILEPPSGSNVTNDDYGGSTSHSRIETTLSATGLYTVHATSYGRNTTGNYTLEYPRSPVPASPAGQRRLSGRLESTDTREDNKYRDVYSFQGISGQRIVVDLASPDFDTYLIVQPPTGAALTNDDFDGETRRSRIDTTLNVSGSYTVIATSFGTTTTGSYILEYPGGTGALNATVVNR
jgi:hypothetical protein